MSLIINNITTITESASGYWQLPAGTTADRPSSPVAGMMRFNTDIEYLELYTNTGWKYFEYNYSFDIPQITFYLQEDTGSLSTDNITTNGTIVISGVNVTNGSWQYSINYGATWSTPLPPTIITAVIPDGIYPINCIQVRQLNSVGYASQPTGNSAQIIIDSAAEAITIAVAGDGNNILDYINIGTANGIISGTVDAAISSLTLTFGNVTKNATINGLSWSYNFVYDDLLELGLGYNRPLYARARYVSGKTGAGLKLVGVNFVGSKVFTSSESWIVPKGVRMISAVCVGAGDGSAPYYTSSGYGGRGGDLRWAKELPTIPLETLTVVVSASYNNGGESSISRNNVKLLCAAGGNAGTSTTIDGVQIGGGNGGNGGYGYDNLVPGGGGAGGYSGNGGQGAGSGVSPTNGSGGAGGGGGSSGGGWPGYSGGGVGLYGQGNSGAGSVSLGGAGSGGVGSRYGGGGGGKSIGGDGAVRIVWGLYRQYPSSNVSTPDTLAIGEMYGGGYYAGNIVQGGVTYRLIVAPRTGGQSSTSMSTGPTTPEATKTLNNGPIASASMNSASFPAAYFCENLTLGGYNDWYMPSRDELELCYRNFKPTSDITNTAVRVKASYNYLEGNDVSGDQMGINRNSSPLGGAYPSTLPRTQVSQFIDSVTAEGFTTYGGYLSSSFFDSTKVWGQQFLNGRQEPISNTTINQYVRAVRREPI